MPRPGDVPPVWGLIVAVLAILGFFLLVMAEAR